ncbi:hypothetical protein V1290_007376 [Bradyrhizobium sp. AZCC 1578]|uniref:hypothetical protein n=1 Tax=Bradyrhizobium sp. AZCC 1578 TaxID=3117027 RepID=UPI002FEFFE9D
MTDTEFIAHLEKVLEFMRSRQGDQTPPPVARAAVKPCVRWKPAARAFADRGFPFDDWLIRRICANHDWALKLPGGWHVKHAEFEEHATLVELGRAKFNTTQKFESSGSSVANSADDEVDCFQMLGRGCTGSNTTAPQEGKASCGAVDPKSVVVRRAQLK